MKKLSIVFCAAALFAACKGKDSLQTDKNIVVMSDTSRAANSYLSDTGTTVLPGGNITSSRAAIVNTPAVRTRTSTQRSTVYTPSTTTTRTTTTSSGGVATTTTRRTGWSKSAKGAVIGGVGGAVVGAVIGKGKGAVIGGILGAGGGYILGRSQDRRDGRIP